MEDKQTRAAISKDMTKLFTVELVTWGVMADGMGETQTITFCNILSFTMKCGSCSKIFETLKLLRKHVESSHAEKCLVKIDRIKEEGSIKAGSLSSACAGTALINSSNTTVNPSVVKTEPASESEEVEGGENKSSVEEQYTYDDNTRNMSVSKIPEHGEHPKITTVWSGNGTDAPQTVTIVAEEGWHCPRPDILVGVKSEIAGEAVLPVTPVTIIHKADAAKLKSTTAEKTLKSTGTDMTELTTSPKKPRKNANSKHHPCPECGSILQSSYKLKIHMRIHTGEKPFICTHVDGATGSPCAKAFSLKYNLQQHQWTHSNMEREKPLKCLVCDLSFWRMHRLKTHTRKHTGEKPYSCDVCGECFSLNSTLKFHRRVHTGEKPFECTICGSKFTVISSLRVHTRIHTGERPFPCDQCDQAFKSNSELRKHFVVHTGEKPHICKECGKSFAMRVNYNSHIKVHSGDLYMCDVCGKSFKTAQSLTRCKKLHEEESSVSQDPPLDHVDQSSLLLLDNLAYNIE